MRFRAAVTLGLALLVVATGCARAATDDGIATAGGGRTSTPTTAPPDAQSDKDKMLAYAQCMRDNGVPEFPDPDFNDGGGVSLSLPDVTVRSTVDAANAKCKQYLPNGGEPGRMDPEQLEKMRAFAQCMREHGLPSFPDPSDEGLAINGNEHPELNPNNPTFKAAEEACRQYAPGPPGDGPGTSTGGGA
jgi:hypothetical protein